MSDQSKKLQNRSQQQDLQAGVNPGKEAVEQSRNCY